LQRYPHGKHHAERREGKKNIIQPNKGHSQSSTVIAVIKRKFRPTPRREQHNISCSKNPSGRINQTLTE
jgi:hypothetical protein